MGSRRRVLTALTPNLLLLQLLHLLLHLLFLFLQFEKSLGQKSVAGVVFQLIVFRWFLVLEFVLLVVGVRSGVGPIPSL